MDGPVARRDSGRTLPRGPRAPGLPTPGLELRDRERDRGRFEKCRREQLGDLGDARRRPTHRRRHRRPRRGLDSPGGRGGGGGRGAGRGGRPGGARAEWVPAVGRRQKRKDKGLRRVRVVGQRRALVSVGRGPPVALAAAAAAGGVIEAMEHRTQDRSGIHHHHTYASGSLNVNGGVTIRFDPTMLEQLAPAAQGGSIVTPEQSNLQYHFHSRGQQPPPQAQGFYQQQTPFQQPLQQANAQNPLVGILKGLFPSA
mmetsp:Transcript_50091/g.113683  ORF Transcript_50091/g.113683 Transcript_50091/m.113683 type:complete len:255 (+) Transcript_50091:406-1170(+)